MQSLVRRRDFEITSTPGFTEWANEQNISIAMSTYRVGAVLMLGSHPDGSPSLQTAAFDRAMGMCCHANAFWLVTQRMIWRFEREKKDESPANPSSNDYLYVPRVGYTTGQVDGHEIAMTDEHGPVFVNTLFNCLATVDQNFNFRPLWYPAFIHDLVPEDRCHLSGIAVTDGKPKYVTMHAQSDHAQGWRDSRKSGGLIMDIDCNEVVAESLSMPHSPRFQNGHLWVLNSGTGHLGKIDQRSKQFEPVSFVPGYARGLSIHSKYAFVGLSKPRRERAFQGLPLQSTLEKHNMAACCGIDVIDMETGSVVHAVRIESSIMELFDVAVLPGALRPGMLSFASSKYAHHFSFSHQGQLHHWESASPQVTSTNTTTASDDSPLTETNELPDMMAPRHMPVKTAKAFNNLGLMHVQRDNLQEAKICFDRAITLDPKHAGAWNNLGNILQRQNRLDDAITCYRHSVASDPSYLRAFFNLAQTLASKGEDEEARKHLQRILEIDPNHREAIAALGQQQ